MPDEKVQPVPRPFSYGIGGVVNPQGQPVVLLALFMETGETRVMAPADEMGDLGVKLVEQAQKTSDEAKLWTPPKPELILPPGAA